MKNFLYSIINGESRGPVAAFLRFLLWILSLFYSSAVKALLFCYEKGILKRHALGRPVISVGNLTVGGVGKTPLVILVSKYLLEEGLRPVILTRGYMTKPGCDRLRTKLAGRKNKHGPQFSDEAQMLRNELPGVPVLVGPDRVSNAKHFIKDNPVDVFVLDDGFQHWKIYRDIDIVVIDSKNPFGNRHVLPRGILREPILNLKRAGFFVLTKVEEDTDKVKNLINELGKIFPDKVMIESSHKLVNVLNLKDQSKIDLDKVKGLSFCSFCSIGDPLSFEATLDELDLKLEKIYSFDDHYNYDEEDLKRIVNHCKENKINNLITTQKDAVKIVDKLNVFTDVNIYMVKIKIKLLKGKDLFFERINSVL